jgi:hypothetical protein
MRTKSRTRSRGLVLAAIWVLVLLPELARAQTSGLFPLAPIRRQRVPCDQEDPAYKIVKERYFGYHPTAWRRFPEGLTIKSKESPDVEKSFRELPLDPGDDLGVAPRERDAEGGVPGQPGQPRQGFPALPPGGSPFEPDAGRGAAPAPGGQPRQNPAIPPMGDPFELDKPDQPRVNPNPPAQPGGGQNRPAAPGATNAPELSAPAERTGQSQSPRRAPDDEPEARDEDGPLLALPNINLPPINDPNGPFSTSPPQTAATDAPPSDGTQPTTATAPRRGFLSGLFNNLGWNWARR